MTVEIAAASYGKQPIRVLRWTTEDDGDTVQEFTLSLTVSGGLSESFANGDNARILSSDTLRRHALASFGTQPAIPDGELLTAVGRRILHAASSFTTVLLEVESRSWRRLGRHTFVADGHRTTTAATITRAAPPVLTGGLRDVELLTTNGSSFTDFLRDPLTVQPDAFDRPLCGTVDADWAWTAEAEHPAGLIADRVLAAFTDRPSNAIQQLVTAVGTAVLDGTPGLAQLSIRFSGLPISPIPADLAGAGYEIGTSPRGVTAVTLTRQPDPVN